MKNENDCRRSPSVVSTRRERANMSEVPLPDRSGSMSDHAMSHPSPPGLPTATFPLLAKRAGVSLTTRTSTCVRSSVPEAKTLVKEKAVASE